MTRNLLKATSVVGAMTLLSRVLGLARDVLFATLIAPGKELDAFLVAFKIPNFLRRLFAEGAFSQAFVPVLSEHKSQQSPAEVRALADHVAGTLGGILLLVTVLGVLGAPLLVYIFAPGFADEPDKFSLTVDMLRITFPYLLFISLTAFAGGILNTFGRFGVPAFTPVLLNLALIGAAVFAAPYFAAPAVALAWGVFIAGVAQLLFQIPFLARLKMLPRPRWGLAHEAVRRILRLMLPAIFGSSVAQLNLLIDTLLASFLVTGSVSWLYLSDRLMEFPLGVFGIALATVVLPSLSQRHAEQSPAQFSATLDWALRLVFLLGAPAAVGLFVLAGPILVTLFDYGGFTDLDARMATASLMPFALGMFAFTLVKILAPGYFARQDTRTPVRIGVYAMLANMLLNGVIVVPWFLSGAPAAHAGLAISTSLAAFLNAGLLYRGLRRGGFFTPAPGWPRMLARVLLANLTMGGLLWWQAPVLADWLAAGGATRAGWLVTLIAAGGALYFMVLFALGVRPRDFTAAARMPAKSV